MKGGLKSGINLDTLGSCVSAAKSRRRFRYAGSSHTSLDSNKGFFFFSVLLCEIK